MHRHSHLASRNAACRVSNLITLCNAILGENRLRLDRARLLIVFHGLGCRGSSAASAGGRRRTRRPDRQSGSASLQNCNRHTGDPACAIRISKCASRLAPISRSSTGPARSPERRVRLRPVVTRRPDPRVHLRKCTRSGTRRREFRMSSLPARPVTGSGSVTIRRRPRSRSVTQVLQVP
jgi:hypothetical protein